MSHLAYTKPWTAESNFIELCNILLQFPSIGSFPGTRSVLFASPLVSVDLIQMHQRFHEISNIEGFGEELCRPGNWFPHVTIAVGIELNQLAPIVEFLTINWTPIECNLDRIRFVELSPVETIWTAGLSGTET
jgi:2'-5' RNA ligase